ncbi:uncharacterized protein PgNI_07569 [Pyricularia grisea]|uniref:Uncharacterized protein n=1 Tax=Pyricularia grisea TaxID=148305 RepID=A0A6P8B281_PYRGI|nr:uncharacterized protein PgNI_07569 [Pyricularia grisea]TLD08909.1 hypothetical protein PgNI_07569 [Pyricularia grisea]
MAPTGHREETFPNLSYKSGMEALATPRFHARSTPTSPPQSFAAPVHAVVFLPSLASPRTSALPVEVRSVLIASPGDSAKSPATLSSPPPMSTRARTRPVGTLPLVKPPTTGRFKLTMAAREP